MWFGYSIYEKSSPKASFFLFLKEVIFFLTHNTQCVNPLFSPPFFPQEHRLNRPLVFR